MQNAQFSTSIFEQCSLYPHLRPQHFREDMELSGYNQHRAVVLVLRSVVRGREEGDEPPLCKILKPVLHALNSLRTEDGLRQRGKPFGCMYVNICISPSLSRSLSLSLSIYIYIQLYNYVTLSMHIASYCIVYTSYTSCCIYKVVRGREEGDQPPLCKILELVLHALNSSNRGRSM